ncbi:hypothetical protein [Streptosporangium amethystogenes]|uniref:hypothetical protein n=1 Tax=Streptosporangium amethystogenes TaxID=2002 RepID=UPI0012FC1E4D|nr:hypothetical protein [Streptosporangium amethystogenes]
MFIGLLFCDGERHRSLLIEQAGALAGASVEAASGSPGSRSGTLIALLEQEY